MKKTFDVYEGPREINEHFDYVNMDDLSGNATQVIENLKRIESEMLARGYKTVEFKTDYIGYDGGFEMRIFGVRDETEKETRRRVEKNTKARDQHKKKKAEADLKKEKEEKKELARLQKKYLKK